MAGIDILGFRFEGYRKVLRNIYDGSKNGAPWILLLLVNVINFQLITNVVANKFGFAASAIFAFNRTCSRVITQVAGAAYNGYWPIITKMIEMGQNNEMRVKYRHLQWVTGLTIIALLAALMVVSVLILPRFPAFNDLLNLELLAWLATGAVLAAISGSVAVVLFASNKTFGYGASQAAIFLVLCIWIGAFSEGASVIYAAKSLVLAEFVMLLICIVSVRRFFRDNSSIKL